jgi:GAF domain-containing protein
MRRRSRAGGEPAKPQRRKTGAGKSRITSKARSRSPSIASLEAKLARLTSELKEALEQKNAASEVLQVISGSAADLQAVFGTLLETAMYLCGSNIAAIWQSDGKAFRLAASRGVSNKFKEFATANPITPGLGTITGRTALGGKTVHVPDVLADRGFVTDYQSRANYRSALGVPLLRQGKTIGVFTLTRSNVQPYTESQIELVENFAAQAVIAIENTRLLNELRGRTQELTEALEQRTATSEVLGLISSSPGELSSVFDAILANALRVCDADTGHVLQAEAGALSVAAMRGGRPEYAQFLLERGPWRPALNSAPAEAMDEKRPVQIADIRETSSFTAGGQTTIAAVELGGLRTVLMVPMIAEEKAIGMIVIYRTIVRPFSDKQVALVENFAKQAVIAIENARLLNELRESLQQQTATADVLKAISRSTFDLGAVLDTLVESAARLCEAQTSFLFRRDGANFIWTAGYGHTPEYLEQWKDRPVPPNRGSAVGRAAAEGAIVHIPDVFEDPEYTSWDSQKAGRYRSVLGVPLLREGNPIGVLGLTSSKPRSFTNKQIELVTTFADQAVIAIENARLLNELRESLKQQTATANVLKVISRSAFDLGTVLDTLLQTAARLCDADQGTITQRRGDTFYRSVSYGFPTAFAEYVRDRPVELGRDTATGRALLEGRVIHIPDVEADPDYTWKEAQRLGGFRALLGVPMLREGVPMGVLTLTRTEAKPFTDKQIELVSTFADQAAIAIENVRLFEAEQQRARELTESLEQQTATAEVLGVINSSPDDLTPVFDAVLKKAVGLCDAAFGMLTRFDGECFQAIALHGVPPGFAEFWGQPRRSSPGLAHYRLTQGENVVQVDDITAEDLYISGNPFRRALGDLAGARTVLWVALRKDDALLGSFVVYRKEVRPFSDKQITLLKNFATQAVIAIENARLLNELRQRTTASPNR